MIPASHLPKWIVDFDFLPPVRNIVGSVYLPGTSPSFDATADTTEFELKN